MKKRIEAALTRKGDDAKLAGLLVQLGPGPTLLGTPDTGMDDDTFARFVQETFGPETVERIPGLGSTDPNRFAVRSKYLEVVGRMPWLNWRARAVAALYSELADTVRSVSPSTTLALVTPVLHAGAAGAEARRVDLAGLAPSQAWRSVGLDLQAWPQIPSAPVILRGVELSTDALAHDLATSPDLDAKVASRHQRGVLLSFDAESKGLSRGLATDSSAQAKTGDVPSDPGGDVDDLRKNRSDPGGMQTENSGGALTLATLPLGYGVAADEPLEHALASIDAHWVILAAPAVAGHEERLQRFASVLTSLPSWPALPNGTPSEQKDYGVAVRSLSDQSQTFLAIANDTPYPIRLAGVLDAPGTASVEDVGRNLRLMPQPVPGGRHLVIDLLPFAVSAIRVGAPKVQMTEVTPYPSEAVLTSMEAQYHELSNQLARLNRGTGNGLGEPSNSGFEPSPVRAQQVTMKGSGPAAAEEDTSVVPGGWKAETSPACSVAIDTTNPHSGQGCLKLVAPSVPAAVRSGDFVPNSASSMIIQAFFRAETPDTRVRVWIQGEAGGQPYLRRSEFTVSTSWDGKAVRASDLPAGGLDSARLRFELMTPGTLWIDDLHIIGELTPKAVRLNAQRTLLEALQAYKAQRYAEFARLSSSHWARHPSVLAASRLNRPADLSEAANASRGGAAAASALSPDRRLR
jgi:hypothetical protein